MQIHCGQTQQVLSEIGSFERSLQSAVFFQGKSQLLSEARRCRTKSLWTSPANPDISLYCGLLKEELCKYVPQVKVSNEDYIDKAARRWLAASQQHVCVVDCDKNLGDALVPRLWVREELLRLSAEAATVISTQSYIEITMSLTCSLGSFFHQALYAGILSPKLSKFLMKDFSSQIMLARFACGSSCARIQSLDARS